MKFIDKHFGLLLITTVVFSVLLVFGLAVYGIWYDKAHQCHDTSTYHWQTYCQTIPIGKSFTVSCTQRYTPDVVCDKP